MQIDFKGLVPDGEMADTCTYALKNLSADELEVAMADLAFKTIGNCEYKPVPAEPLVLIQFNNDRRSKSWDMMAQAKKAEITAKIHNYSEVQVFMKKMSTLTAQNMGNAKALEDYISIWVEWDEVEKADKCHELYRRYPATMSIGKTVIWQRKEKDFAKR